MPFSIANCVNNPIKAPESPQHTTSNWIPRPRNQQRRHDRRVVFVEVGVRTLSAIERVGGVIFGGDLVGGIGRWVGDFGGSTVETGTDAVPVGNTEGGEDSEDHVASEGCQLPYPIER